MMPRVNPKRPKLCTVHPRYMARREPRVKCEACWLAFANGPVCDECHYQHSDECLCPASDHGPYNQGGY